MNLPALISLAGLLGYGALIFIVLRRGSRRTRTEQWLFLLYLALMALWQCTALIVSLARDEALALRWYGIMSTLILGQFVIYSAFVRAFFHLRGQRFVIWIGLALWGLVALLVTSHRADFIAAVYWTDTTHFFLPVFGDLVLIYAIPNYIFLGYAIGLLYSGYRGADSALQRVRIRYLSFGLSVVGIGLLTNLSTSLKPYPFDILANILNALMIAYAILRYQLLDISFVIRKGLVYSIPTVMIGISYFLVLSLTFNLVHVALGYQFFVLSLALAAVTAVVVQPLRDRLQAAVDRLFLREKYDSGLMLQRLSRTAATVLDLDRLAVMIVDDITHTLHSTVVAFFVKHGESGQYVLRAHKGLEATPQDQLRLRRDHPIATWLLRHQTSLTRQQINMGPEFIGLWATEREAIETTRSELFVPLLVREDLIGILVLGPRLSELPYAPDDRLTLTTLANQMAIAVENARLFSLEQAKVKVTSTLLDVARAVSSTLNLDELLQLIAQRAAEVCGFDRCNMFLVDKDKDTLRLLASQFASASGLSEQEQSSHQARGLEQIESSSLLKRVMEERRPAIVDRDAIAKLPATWSKTVDAKGVLIVPLISKGRAIGLMTLDHLEGERRVGEDQIDLAATIASHVSVAIEKASLYQETVTEKERTATIVERALAGIALVNPELRIVSINRAVEAITGYDIGQAQGQELTTVFGPGITADNGLLKRAIASGKPVGPAETTLATAVGNRDVLLGVTPLPDGYLLSLSDITPLKELNRLKSDIIANVSHEFRTPLSVIKGYTELLLDDTRGSDPAIRKGYLQVVNGATDRLTAMISDLLDLARMEAEQGSANLESVSLQVLIEDAVCLMGFQSRERDIKIDLNITPDLPMLLGNRELLVTLVRNLLSNAVKFSLKGGTVQVRAGRQDGCIELEVINQGIGVPSEDIPRLFEKFYRSTEVKKAGIQGTGLGLVLVKHAVDNHKGKITVTSAPEVGTCFRVMLPIP